MKSILSAISLLAFTSFTPAAELKPFDFSPPTKNIENEVCKFKGLKLPSNYLVLATGAYKGYRTGFQIDASGHEATQFDVAVNYENIPVVLVLSAYEPSIWNIGWSQRTKIAAVLVSGYHKQVVAGLDVNVPLLISTYDNKSACGYFNIDYNSPRIDEINKKTLLLFDKKINMIYPVTEGKVLVGNDLTASTKLVTSSQITPASYRDITAPLAGKAGLEEAIKNGVLRLATSEDAETWANQVLQNSNIPLGTPAIEMAPPRNREIQKISLLKAYVVLGEFTYPAGLWGADSVNFLIPKGIAKPKGNSGHSNVYDFNTLPAQN